MSKKSFIQNIRTAVQFLTPRVDADNVFSRPDELRRKLADSPVWLTPHAVEGFNARDFGDLPEPQRAGLARDVEAFAAVAQKVSPKAAATRGQVDSALPRFLNIMSTVRAVVLDDWVRAATALVDQAQAWSDARKWPSRRYQKQISEDFIGTYDLTKLVFAVQGAQLVLSPVGRFTPKSEGLFDLAVLPDYESTIVLRQAGRWRIYSERGEAESRDWSEEVFVETSEGLARVA